MKWDSWYHKEIHLRLFNIRSLYIWFFKIGWQDIHQKWLNFVYKHGIPNVSLTSPEHVGKKFDPLGLPNRLYVYFGFLATLLKIEISANF